MWRNVRANQTELKRRRGSVRFDRPSAERQSRWLGRTELSPSTARSSPSKPSRAHDLPSRARAEGLLGLLGLISGLAIPPSESLKLHYVQDVIHEMRLHVLKVRKRQRPKVVRGGKNAAV